jgi:hypothetical protein
VRPARGRAPGIIAIEATQRPSADIIPTSLRDLFGYRWAFRCSTEASSDTILGHGWASKGYTAEEFDRSHAGCPERSSAMTFCLVGRTYHYANHDLVVVGDPLPVRLRRSRARKAPQGERRDPRADCQGR